MSNIQQQTFAILKKYNLAAKKKFGQNFLIDQNILDNIVIKSELKNEDIIMEIGPGLGNLTRVLLETKKSVLAYEIDQDMVRVLESEFVNYPNLKVIKEDILTADLTHLKGKKIAVIANLPYYITTPILFKLLESNLDISFFTLMVQKEVASRICGKQNTKDYNALSVILQQKANTSLLFNVSKEVFIPKPNVDSAVIKLEMKAPSFTKEFEEKFIKLVKASFVQRRKTLVNNLALTYDISKENLQKILTDLSIKETARAESLSLADFINLTEEVEKCY